MSVDSIREKLYDYIRVADDKKIKAIYTMLEDDVIKQMEWWKEKKILDELNKRFEAWENGKEKAFTLNDLTAIITARKQKRAK